MKMIFYNEYNLYDYFLLQMYSSSYMKGMRMKLITGAVGFLLILLITNIETAPTSQLLSKLAKGKKIYCIVV